MEPRLTLTPREECVDRITYMGGVAGGFWGDLGDTVGCIVGPDGDESHYIRSKVIIDVRSAGRKFEQIRNSSFNCFQTHEFLIQRNFRNRIEKADSIWMSGMRKNLLYRSLFYNLSGIHYRDPVRNFSNHAQRMGNQ